MSPAPPQPANRLFDLTGRVVIVTGASSGIGARFAQVLYRAGANVVMTARRIERMEELAGEFADRMVAVQADVTKPADCEGIIATAIERYGQIDVLVNNAGMTNVVKAQEEAYEDFRRVIDVNLNGLFHLCQLAGRTMLAHGRGSIINVGSVASAVALAPINQAGYVASKAGVAGLTRELAVQWARKGVRVNAIGPGWFPSELTEEMFEEGASNDYMKRECPMARGGELHELDGVLLFLASDASSYCTGQTLYIDGGWTAR